MQAYLESIVCKFGGDPTICRREVMVSANSVHCGQTDCNPSLPRSGEVGLIIIIVFVSIGGTVDGSKKKKKRIF